MRRDSSSTLRTGWSRAQRVSVRLKPRPTGTSTIATATSRRKRINVRQISEAHVTAYSYDAEGHRTSVTEPGLQVTTLEYGERGELTLVRQPAASTHGPTETRVLYDAARQPLRQVDARGHAVEMTWDDLGRLDRRTQLGAPDGVLVTDPSYDANGNQTGLVDAKGQIIGQTFDPLNRVQARAWTFAPNDPYRPWRHTTSMGYTWDPNGNLLRVEESVASDATVRGVFPSPSRGSDRPDR
jgi:YD repeat-containing protein